MDINILDNISKKMNKLGIKININDENNKILKYLIMIEEAIIKNKNIREAILEDYKDTKLTKKLISENIDISRQTLYHYNDILIPYIELSIENQRRNNLFSRNKKLYDKIKLLEDELDHFYKKDLEMEILKQRIKRLKEEIMEKQKDIEIQKMNLNDKSKQIKGLKKKLNKYKVININRKEDS